MITTKEIKMKLPADFTSEYIEEELKKQGYDLLRWAIVGFDGEFYLLNIAIVID